ncbi:MAG TPA: transporter substrate-binding domain-containing protein [Pseudolabrys sp.]|jgi:polar amino acid transport system substrate-binding protein
MKRFAAIAIALTIAPSLACANDLAPGGTLRAVYLATNPAQAVRDPATGETRGVSADLARELGKRHNMPVQLIPSANPATVIAAVTKGEADIGFVAFAPERVGTVEFSQVYMLVQQSFIVPDNSRIKSVKDIDTAGLRISGGAGDSVTLYMKRKIKQAILIETDNTPADAKKKFAANEIDAFGANRQRLTTMLKDMPGYHILPDSLFGVTQTIIVPKGKAEVLAAVNRFIDDVRTSGFLQNAVEKSGIVGLSAAPAGSWTPSVPE